MSEFDYKGWAARGAWRRTLLLNNDHNNNNSKDNQKNHLLWDRTKEEEEDERLEGGMLVSKRRWISPAQLSTQWGDEYTARNGNKEIRASAGTQPEQVHDFGDRKEALFVRRRQNCWLHCDFPSECHHAMYKAQREGRPVLARAMAVDDAYVALKKVERARLRTMGDGAYWGLSIMQEEEDDEENEESDSGDSTSSTASATSPPSLLTGFDDDENERHEQIEFVTGEEEVDGYLDEGGSQDETFPEPAPVPILSGGGKICKKAKIKTMDTFDMLHGDYSYESFKRSLPSRSSIGGSIPNELDLSSSRRRRNSTSTPRTDFSREEAGVGSASRSTPHSPFSLASQEVRAAAGIEEVSCCDPAVLAVAGCSTSQRWQQQQGVLLRDEQQNTAAVDVDAISFFSFRGAIPISTTAYGYANDEDDDDESLNGLLNALFGRNETTTSPSQDEADSCYLQVEQTVQQKHIANIPQVSFSSSHPLPQNPTALASHTTATFASLQQKQPVVLVDDEKLGTKESSPKTTTKQPQQQYGHQRGPLLQSFTSFEVFKDAATSSSSSLLLPLSVLPLAAVSEVGDDQQQQQMDVSMDVSTPTEEMRLLEQAYSDQAWFFNPETREGSAPVTREDGGERSLTPTSQRTSFSQPCPPVEYTPPQQHHHHQC